MPSFGLPNSLPPVSSSLTPCISTLLSSSISSCSESSCVPAPDLSLSQLFESAYMSPPPPLSLPDPAPYSTPPAYPPVFPFGPPLLASTRFPPPPPPNTSFAQPVPNVTFFEGLHSHYPPEPHTAYDRWSDRNTISSPYGSDSISKRFSHWPLPTFNSSINSNSNNGNSSNFRFLKPEPAFPSLTPYPPLNSLSDFGPDIGPRFSPLPGDSSTFPNAAVMPSTSSAPVTSPLASGHFTAFASPNMPLDFPHSSARLPFNPLASTFFPGMDPPASFGAGNAEFMPEPIPGYLSRTGGFLPPSSFQTPDHFHDASSRPIHSPETAPRPIRSNSPSCFFGPHPHSFNGSSITTNALLSHSLSSRSNNAPGPICYSEVAPVMDTLSEFPAPSTLPYPPPLTGTLFSPYSPPYQDLAGNRSGQFSPRREERAERIVSDTSKLMYQDMSAEEWRWKHYEPMHADALDLSGSFARVRPSGYNNFHGVDYMAPNSLSCLAGGLAVKEEGSSLDALKSQKEQYDILERSKAQNNSGPSLKLAASALADMLAFGPSVEASSTSRSMLAQIASTSGTALTSDAAFPAVNASSGGQVRPEKMAEDCCSSSGSAVVNKEVRNSPLIDKVGGLTAEDFSSGLNLSSPTRSKWEIPDQLEDAFCDFGNFAPAAWPLPKASGEGQSSTNPRPMSWVDGLPQSAKGGALHTAGQRRVFSKGSAGIMKQPAASTVSTKLHGVNAESSTSGTFNNVFMQPSNVSSRPSGRTRKVGSQPVGALSSGDPTSVVGPFTSKAVVSSGLSAFDPHQEVSSSRVGSQLTLDSSRNEQWHVKSTSCGSSPPLSQAYLDLHGSISGRTSGAASRVLANLKMGFPDSPSQTEVAYLGTGFHSLTASIANLSKVLFSLDSSALTPPDSAVLEETLQSSILRLSECLLLEQSRINRNPATRFVGSDESSGSRLGRAAGPLADLDVARHAETGCSTNQDLLKASDINRSGIPAQPCDVNDQRAAAAIAALETVASSPSAQLLGAIDFLRENDMLERSSLERLIGAEAREAQLKVLVEKLREELEVERVENKGAAFLCEKIMQEAEVSKGKAVMQVAEKAAVESKRVGLESNLQFTSSSTERSNLERNCKTKSLGYDGQSNLESHDKVDCTDLEDQRDSAAHLNSSKEPVLSNLDQLESRLAFLRARPAPMTHLYASDHASRNESGEVTDAVTRGDNRFEDALLNKSGGAESRDAALAPSNTSHDICGNVESRLSILQARPASLAPSNTSHDISGSVESRLALLQARPAVLAQLNASRDSSGDEESRTPDTRLSKWPQDVCTGANTVETQLSLLQARPAATFASNSDDAPRDTDEVQSPLSAIEAVGPHDALKDIDPVEVRLALLQTRPGWDNELGVFTETEPCTPANPAAVDLDVGSSGLTGRSLRGIHEERVAFATKALEAMSHITSQLLIQSETISNMHTAWSQLSEQVNLKNPETESSTELQQKEADMEFLNTSSRQAFDDSHAVEARALLITSRPNWTEGDGMESETEDFLGGQVCKISSLGSGCVSYEADQFETLSEISLVRLLDADIDVSQPVPVMNATDYPSVQGATGDASAVDSAKFDNGTPSKSQDSEEDGSWEHVRLPQKEAE